MTAKWKARPLLVAALLLAAFAAPGCGKRTATITGTVTCNNRKVTSGEVFFLTEDGKAGGHGPIGPDGTYTAENVPVGKLKVFIQNPAPAPFEGPTDPNDPEVKGARERAARYTRTPEQYADPDKSGLTIVARPGKNDFPISLK